MRRRQMSENEEVNEAVANEITELIGDFVPAAEPTQNTEILSEEVKASGEEGQERSEEKGGEQVEGAKPEEEKVVAKPVEMAEPVAEPVVEKKPVVEEKSELDRIREENVSLRLHIEEVVGKLSAPKPQQVATPEQQRAAAEQTARQILQFIPDNEKFDVAMSDAKNFNALLTSVVNTAVERSIRVMPQIMSTLVDHQMTLKSAVTDFYRVNDDLVPHKKYVGFVANEVTAAHPDWELENVLKEVEGQVRGKLGLARSSSQSVSPIGRESTARQSNPGFVPSSGGSRRGSTTSTGNLSRQEKDILDLIQ
jgi:hypothetical protein